MKYRIKAEREFYDEYGSNWRALVCWNKEMDYLLGNSLVAYQGLVFDMLSGDISEIRIPRRNFDYWYIYPAMVTTIESSQTHHSPSGGIHTDYFLPSFLTI